MNTHPSVFALHLACPFPFLCRQVAMSAIDRRSAIVVGAGSALLSYIIAPAPSHAEVSKVFLE